MTLHKHYLYTILSLTILWTASHSHAAAETAAADKSNALAHNNPH